MLRRRITMVPLVTSLALLMVSLISSAHAADQGAAPVEGESFTKPPGTQVVLGDQYSGGKALKITNSKAVPTKRVTITETSNMLVRARAGQTGGSPTLTIRVDGQNAGTRRITSSTLQDYLYAGIVLEVGTYTIGLKGGNIASGRNVFVDLVKFVPVEVEPPDTTAPVITTSGIQQGDNANTAVVEFSANEPATFECSFREQSQSGPSWHGCASPSTYANIPDGTYVFHLRATDTAGNVSEVHQSTITIGPPPDTTSPEITVTGTPEGPTSYGQVGFNLEANEPVTWQCTYVLTAAGETEPRPEVESGCYGGPVSYDLNSDGTYVFTFKAKDAAGNTSTVTKTIILDRSNPTVSITSGPEEGATVDTGSVSFGWSAEDNIEVEDVRCYLEDHTNSVSIRVDGNTSGTAQCGGTSHEGEDFNPATFSNLADGRYTFHIYAYDIAGQPSSIVSRTFTVDTTPETLTVGNYGEPSNTGAANIGTTRPLIQTFETQHTGELTRVGADLRVPGGVTSNLKVELIQGSGSSVRVLDTTNISVTGWSLQFAEFSNIPVVEGVQYGLRISRATTSDPVVYWHTGGDYEYGRWYTENNTTWSSPIPGMDLDFGFEAYVDPR
jgi:hypothetical protein